MEDISKLKQFMDMVEKSNFKKLELELLKKIENLKVDDWNEELKKKLDGMKRAVAEGHEWIFHRFELHIKTMVKDDMYWRTVKRSDIKVMVYNFTDSNSNSISNSNIYSKLSTL